MSANLDETFAALADATRRAMVRLLREGPRRGADLANGLDISLSAVNQHLEVLQRGGLVVAQPDDERSSDAPDDALYRLSPERLAELRPWLDAGKQPPRQPAKTTPPRAARAIDRPRLFERLDSRPAAWLVAPAGSGKTTLARSYAAARGLTLLWYRVDASDADPHTLFDYLGRQCPGPLPRPPAQGALAPFAARFFETLYDQLPARSLVVIDDCHAAGPDAPLGEVLRAAVLSLPDTVRLLMGSREPPPPPVSSLLGRQAMTLLAGPDLRFTPAETQQLLEGRAEASAAERMHHLSRGWAAALVLLADRIARGAELPSGTVEPGQPLFDFLSVELFDYLDPRDQDVLLATSEVTQISQGHAVALSGYDNAGRVLARLARGGVLVERLDTEPPSYTCHPLLRSFLQARLEPAARADLRRRSAALLEEAGAIEQVAELVRDDEAGLGDLVLRHAPALMSSGRAATVRDWLATLSETTIEADGWLSYWRAATDMATSPKAAHPRFERAFDAFLSAGDQVGACLAWAGATQAVVYAGDCFTPLQTWLERFDQELGDDLLSALPAPIRAQVTGAMTFALQVLHADASVSPWAERALADAAEAKTTDGLVMAGSVAALHFGLTCQIDRTEQVVRQLEHIADSPAAEPIAQVTAKLVRSLYDQLRLDYSSALTAVEAGLALAEREGIHALRDSLLVYGTYSALAVGDVTRATRYGDALAALPRLGWLSEMNLYTVQALVLQARGDLGAAREAAEAAVRAARQLGGAPMGLGLVLAAASHIAVELGEPTHVDELLSLAEGSTSPMLVYWAHMAAAHVALAAGDLPELDRQLAMGLALARARGLLQVVLPSHEILARLLARALRVGIEPAHVRRVIGGLNLRPPDDVPPEWPLPVQLRTLGRFEVLVDGQPLTRRGAPCKLLEAVVASGPGPISHGQLGDLLWPDSEGDAARRALDTNLHRLRRLLGRDDVVRLVDGRLSVDPQSCFVDADVFEALCDRIARQVAAGDEDALLDLYRGPFLPTRDEHWVLRRRDKLRRRFVSAVEALLAHREAHSEREAAARLCERALAIEPAASSLSEHRRRYAAHHR